MFSKELTDYLIANNYNLVEESEAGSLYKCGPINVLATESGIEIFGNKGDFVLSTVPFKQTTVSKFQNKERRFIHNYFNVDL